MDKVYHQIIDANINRVSEGLRVIEDYTRFISKQKSITKQLARLRKQINTTEKDIAGNLLIRNTQGDMRAGEKPSTRHDAFSLLKANFKRVEEGLRVLEEYTGNPFYNKARYETYGLEKEIILTAMKKNIKAGVYLISDDPKILELGLGWGVSCIQLRDKKSTKKVVLNKALLLQKKAKKANIPFIINDYLDIAILCNADGLHTGQDDLDIPSIRKLIGPHKIIGRSTHTLAEGLKAQNDGADYIGIGPIWSTPTKPERAAIGFDYLQKAKNNLTIPYAAIGGINLKRVPALMSFHPPLVAVVSAYQEIPGIIKYLAAKQS